MQRDRESPTHVLLLGKLISNPKPSPVVRESPSEVVQLLGINPVGLEPME